MHKVPNRSPHPDRCLIWHEDVARLLHPNVRVIGLLHTHYDAVQGSEPSQTDLDHAPDPTNHREYDVPGIVYNVELGTIRWYDGSGVIRRERVAQRVFHVKQRSTMTS